MELLGEKTSRLFLHFCRLIIIWCFIQQIQSAETNASTISRDSEYHCVWYGQCGYERHLHQNCPYNGTAKSLNDEGRTLLSKWCPDLMVDNGNGVKTCCDTEQLKTLDQNLQLVLNILGSCPSCLHNFVKHVCQLVCATDQSRFIKVTDVKTKNGTQYIMGVDYYISDNYISGTFNSCKYVSLSIPEEGRRRALDIMCGAWGASRCTPLRWFHFMGDAENNPYVPFQTTYVITSTAMDKFVPMDAPIEPWNIDAQSANCNVSTVNKKDGEYHCVWYGQCGNKRWSHQYCPYNGTAKPLSDEGQTLLDKWCPDLLVDEGDGVLTCCDTEQLKSLDRKILMASSLLDSTRISLCMDNFLKHVCQLVCAPDQSRFINVTDVITTSDSQYIMGIDYYISNKYISDTFNSCIQVNVSSTGERALDIICGEQDSSNCTPLQWFQYMGDPESNPFAAFQITYINSSTPVGNFIPMEPINPDYY